VLLRDLDAWLDKDQRVIKARRPVAG
jgi:hypothetical protein